MKDQHLVDLKGGSRDKEPLALATIGFILSGESACSRKLPIDHSSLHGLWLKELHRMLHGPSFLWHPCDKPVPLIVTTQIFLGLRISNQQEQMPLCGLEIKHLRFDRSTKLEVEGAVAGDVDLVASCSKWETTGSPHTQGSDQDVSSHLFELLFKDSWIHLFSPFWVA
jgi:hypothetical protein